MSTGETPEPDRPASDTEVGPEIAAEMLGMTVARVLELVKVGAVPSRLDGETSVMRVADLVVYREERARRRPAMREINQIVNETPSDWDA